MLTLLSSFLGFLSAGFPNILGFFQDRQDKKHELEILKLQMEQQKQGHNQRLQEIEIDADIAEKKALYKHASQPTGIPWVEGLRGSVRPIITYSFFLLFAVVKILTIAKMLDSGNSGINSFLGIWDQDTRAIFAAIISFWFGQRTLSKFSGK
ncbi:hypothetical protein [Rickettsia endosymbiont of Cardiosporidium cionae]|uniref:hypothetical protein n=1 Tax=Rickettsia endosymbiont of Cardiosporidium cionae TaxID=2777155 RepID=UPI001E460141|nr:hypothetical protein [Rickettsia endosymbiont of Cardiosporidium cionae]KAF8818091.1 hypothetical protein IHI24_000890 [Rickettsia endosymbiont of Cardiosporidium cionae]